MSLDNAPDIEESLRYPDNELGYRSEYNKLLTERAMPLINEALRDDPNKDEVEAKIRALFEGEGFEDDDLENEAFEGEEEENSMIIEGKLVKALADGGLLKVASIVARTDIEPKNGWLEKKRMSEWEEKLNQEVWGVVERYYVELPDSEGRAPVTTSLVLEAKQQKLEGEKSRYGTPMWGDIDYNKWTLTRT